MYSNPSVSIQWLLVTVLFLISAADARSYIGYSLLRVTPQTESQLQYLLKINSNSSIGIDFWLRTTAVNKSADVMVAPRAKNFFEEGLKGQHIPFTVMIKDIGKVIAEDDAAPVADPSAGFFGSYNRYGDMIQFILQLARVYPEFVTPLDIGRSSENRPLIVLKICTSHGKSKPAIWIQGGAHARELPGPAAVAYIALQLITLSQEDANTAEIINEFDWYIMPVLNPDGYEYALSKDRLWRKTRSRTQKNTECVGVDANRNWDFHWSESAGASRDPCSQNYAGPVAFSEPETRAVSQFMSRYLNGSLLLFLDIHSYSQRWMTPWGYTTEKPPNYEEQKRLANVATEALSKVYGTKYTVGSSAGTLYTVSGGARDWVYGVIGAQYSYVVELRDDGRFGFVLPKAQILPSAIEAWEGVRAMACELHRSRNQHQQQSNETDAAVTTAPNTDSRDSNGFAYGIAVIWRT